MSSIARLGGLGILAALAMILPPTIAVAVSASKAPAPPGNGKWLITDNESFGDTTGGSFTVSGGPRHIASLTIDRSSDLEGCGASDTVIIAGHHRIVRYDDEHVENGYVVGTPVHHSTGITPAKVTVTSGGRTYHGKLSIFFASRNGDRAHSDIASAGDLTYSRCDIEFNLKRR